MNEVDTREREYWNRLYNSAPENLIMDVTLFKSSAIRVFQLELLGDLNGKRLLELGCGDGQWAVVCALLGAEVIAIDISDEATNLTAKRAEINGISDKVKAIQMSAYSIEFPDGYFDLIHGTSILHHLNCRKVGPEISRVLRNGGRGVFMENFANNPLLIGARKLCGHFGIPKWSSDDEYPLRKKDVKSLRPFFSSTAIHYPEFRFFFYFNAKLFKYRNKFVNRTCDLFDITIYRRLPALRQFGYSQILEFRA